MKLLKQLWCAAGLIFALAGCVSMIAAQEGAKPGNSSAAQEPAKAGDSSPAQKSLEPFNFPDFTAIQRIGGPTGAKSILMKVYSSGSTVRVDLSPKMTQLFITSTDKVYKLNSYPDNTKSCVVMPRNHKGFVGNPLEMLQGAKVERTPAGTDVVDGHKCKVEDVVVTRADGAVVKSKVWEAEDFKGVPVKIISEAKPDPNRPPIKDLALYGDFKFEKVDPALLTPPDNCIPIEKTYKVVEHTEPK